MSSLAADADKPPAGFENQLETALKSKIEKLGKPDFANPLTADQVIAIIEANWKSGADATAQKIIAAMKPAPPKTNNKN